MYERLHTSNLQTLKFWRGTHRTSSNPRLPTKNRERLPWETQKSIVLGYFDPIFGHPNLPKKTSEGEKTVHSFLHFSGPKPNKREPQAYTKGISSEAPVDHRNANTLIMRWWSARSLNSGFWMLGAHKTWDETTSDPMHWSTVGPISPGPQAVKFCMCLSQTEGN